MYARMVNTTSFPRSNRAGLAYSKDRIARCGFSWFLIKAVRLAQLQRFLRHDHHKTTEIYSDHIEMGTRKQTDCLADFWQRKLVYSDNLASIPASIKCGK